MFKFMSDKTRCAMNARRVTSCKFLAVMTVVVTVKFWQVLIWNEFSSL